MSVLAAALLAAALTVSAPAGADLADEYTPGDCITNVARPMPFTDVPLGQWYSNAIGWAFLNEITTGTSATTFSPFADVTRAEFATFLHRMICEPDATGVAPFGDLVAGAFYRAAVDWLFGEGITEGKSPTRFAPDDRLTRGEFATFLHRLVGEPADAPVSHFVDVPRGEFYAEAVDWLFDRGITTGTSATEFSPGRAITRAEVVTLLYRMNLAAAGVVDPATIELGFEVVASGFASPLGAALHPDGGVFVIGKGGAVWFVAPDADGLPDWGTPAAEVTPAGLSVSSAGEQGLLGVAVAPDGDFLYLSYTDTAGDSVVEEYDLDASAAIVGGPRTVITVDQPASNHNGGHVTFGPDGYLYASFGDGGGGCDSAGSNGQDASTHLGSIIRIAPGAGAVGHSAPADNPGFAEEDNWLIGVRNPWRFTFDRATGDLWVGDVGQNAFEEITRLPATGGTDAGKGTNLGWPSYEGTARTCGAADIGAHAGPTWQYANPDRGRSVTGGAVYRGDAIEHLAGTYLYTDFYDPDLRGFNDTFGTGPVDYGAVMPGGGAAAFFEDADGEVYVVSMFSGTILQIVAAG